MNNLFTNMTPTKTLRKGRKSSLINIYLVFCNYLGTKLNINKRKKKSQIDPKPYDPITP